MGRHKVDENAPDLKLFNFEGNFFLKLLMNGNSTANLIFF